MNAKPSPETLLDKKPSLAELLARSLDDDATAGLDADTMPDWDDDDDGSSGG